jgi:membrane protease YdiL (CAAX protease family)
MFEMIWLGIVLPGLAVWTLTDRKQYEALKTVDETAKRQRFYLQWTLQGFVLLVGASAVTALALGRDLPLLTLPLEFQSLAATLRPPSIEDQAGEGQIGLAIGLGLGLAVAVGVQVWRMRRALKTIVGDVEAMIPRNRKEMLAALPLCFSAGIGEELFFRLALPLLIASVTGSVILAFAASAVIFGLIHAYQGWKGIIATTFAGFFLTYVYLSSGSIVRPMILHVVIDVLALIVRPALARYLGLSGNRHATPADTGS